MSASLLISEFCELFTGQAGIVHQVKDSKAAVTSINEIISAQGKAGDVCCTPAVSQALGVAEDSLRASISSSALFREDDVIRRLDRLDVGITLADYGVAETGAIVEVAYNDAERLLSSISRVHIAILDSGRIIGKLSELAVIVRSLLKKQGPPQLPSITLISGPSRTSDIELKSVLGVHGPHEMHVILLSR